MANAGFDTHFGYNALQMKLHVLCLSTSFNAADCSDSILVTPLFYRRVTWVHTECMIQNFRRYLAHIRMCPSKHVHVNPITHFLYLSCVGTQFRNSCGIVIINRNNNHQLYWGHPQLICSFRGC